jgi:hypothetical protein
MFSEFYPVAFDKNIILAHDKLFQLDDNRHSPKRIAAQFFFYWHLLLSAPNTRNYNLLDVESVRCAT